METIPIVIVDLGISLVPEGRESVSRSSPSLENLELGAFTKRARPFMKETSRMGMPSLFPILREREDQLAGKDEWRRAANDSHWKGIDVPSRSF